MRVKNRRKLEIFGVAVALVVVVYICIRYLLPLVWPFILAYGLACLIYPVARFLHRKLHFHKTAAAVVTLLLAIASTIVVLYFVMDIVWGQLMSLISRLPIYEERILLYLEKMCGMVEKACRMDRGTFYHIIYDGLGNVMGGWQEKMVQIVMNNSVNTFMLFFDVFLVLALTIMAIFYMLKDMDSIRTVDKNNIFYSEIVYLKKLISKVLRAYVRSQLIIIGILSVVCAVGLAIIGNKYNIIIGFIIGVCDALPLIGVGTILVPWSVICFFTGNYVNGAILFVVFILCYLIREFLEPRLMGKEIGLSPISTLISIFVGYKLFGFLGMIVGPLVTVMIREILSLLKSRGY